MRNPFSFSNIRRGLISTVFGIALLGLSVGLIIAGTIDATEMIMIALLGLGLLGINDPRKPGNTAKVLIPLAFVAFSGCCTYQKCYDKYASISQDSVFIEVSEPVVISAPVPPDSLELRMQLDSLLWASVEDTIRFISEKGRAEAKFWKDKYNNYLHARIDCKPDTIILYDTLKGQVKAPAIEFKPPAPKPERKGFFQKLFDEIKYFLLVLGITVIALLLVSKYLVK